MSHQKGEFAELIRLVQEGSADAAQKLHALYGGHILQAVRRRLHQRLRSKFDSLDFVQDVWASFFTDIPENRAFDGPDDLVKFLTAVAKFKVSQEVRARMQRQKHNVNLEVSLDRLPGGADRHPASVRTPSEIVMGEEEWDRFLQKQPLVHRRVLLLLREGKSSVTIAEELGVTQRTVNRIVRKIVPGKPS
jgi:RNA polymerase sigma-70 factor (ECF subfamily)